MSRWHEGENLRRGSRAYSAYSWAWSRRTGWVVSTRVAGEAGTAYLYFFDATRQTASLAAGVLGALALAQLWAQWHDVDGAVDGTRGVVLLVGLEILVVGGAGREYTVAILGFPCVEIYLFSRYWNKIIIMMWNSCAASPRRAPAANLQIRA